VRVIQIWFAAGLEHRGLKPHYQQAGEGDLPAHAAGDARVYSLIGDGSPMEQHMRGRLTATTVRPGGTTELEPPQAGEDLFLYVTDGAGALVNGNVTSLGQYDVILATPDAPEVTLEASPEDPAGLRFLSFYLPDFLSR
jgi:redox-sensitive bicupin YhaK (pirin superfamily)